jgi:hypothetical protein
MGSKKYKGKPCVYCVDGVSDDGEHIISRNFFPTTYRGNLPKAPACKRCNRGKSVLEHYLTAVLPFSSNHKTALKSQGEKVNRRLSKNLPLKNELRSGISPVWMTNDSDLPEETISLPFQPEKIIEYCEYIVRGLVWYEWDVIFPKEYVIEVMTLTQHGYSFFRDYILKMSPDFRRDKIYADGGFSYTCTRNSDDAAFSAWHLRFYEKLYLAGQTDEGGVEHIEICALTGPQSIRSIVKRFIGNAD